MVDVPKIVGNMSGVLSMAACRLGRWLSARFPRDSAALEAESTRRVLCVRTAYLGDAILTLPALSLMRRRFPNAEITLLTCPAAAEALQGHTDIDHLISYEAPWFFRTGVWGIIPRYINLVFKLRSRRFDLAVDFRGDGRDLALILLASGARNRVARVGGWRRWLLTHSYTPHRAHEVDAALELVRYLGCQGKAGPIVLPGACSDSEDHIERILRWAPRPWIGLHPGGRLPLKRWGAESFREVAAALHEETGGTIIITGIRAETRIANRIGTGLSRCALLTHGELSLAQLQALIRKLDLYITNDTAVLHLASGVDTPTVAIFGPSEPWATGPLSRLNVIVRRDLPCRHGCDAIQCASTVFHECLRRISVDEVLSASRGLLAGREHLDVISSEDAA